MSTPRLIPMDRTRLGGILSSRAYSLTGMGTGDHGRHRADKQPSVRRGLHTDGLRSAHAVWTFHGRFCNLNQPQTSSLILRWADVNGDPGDLRYMGIWMPNSGDRAWNCDGVDDDIPTVQSQFNADVRICAPGDVAATPDGGDLMMYDDSQMPFWQAWDGMTSADYQTKFCGIMSPTRFSRSQTGANRNPLSIE